MGIRNKIIKWGLNNFKLADKKGYKKFMCDLKNKGLIEGMTIRGETTLEFRHKDGTLFHEIRDKPNTITNAGLAALADLLLADLPGSTTGFDYIALGTGTGSTAASTTLNAEITTNGGSRRGGANTTGTRVTTTQTNDTSQLVTTFTFTGSLAITEAGIGNNAAADTGDLLAFQEFNAVNVANTDTLKITWKIVFA